MKRIAVTGASGFIGRHLAHALEQRGAMLLAVAREGNGTLRLDATDADAVVHLAFPTSTLARHEEPLAAFRGVVRDAVEVVRLAERLGAQHVVLASTGKVFGAGAATPIQDADPPRPTTQLGRLKLAAEEIVRAGAGAVDLSVTALRIFNAYGPGQSGDFFFPTLLAGLAAGRLRLGELDHARDWVHVRDVAEAFVTALAHPPSRGVARALNVASGRACTVRDILELVRALGHAVPDVEVVASKRSGEAGIERADGDGLRAMGWKPETILERGLEDLLGHGRGAR